MVAAPHDHAAETAVLGIVLNTCPPDTLERALALIDPGDFHKPQHANTWAAVAKLHANGRPVDVWTVADELRALGLYDRTGDPVALVGEHTPMPSRLEHYCGIVIAHSRRRLIQRAALDAATAAAEGADPDTTADTLLARLAELDRPDPDQLPDRLSTVRDFLNRPGERKSPWVIPGLLRLDWRVVLVAPEGTGKSVVLRALAGYSAQGVHPFTGDDIEPVRALAVDLENPDEPLDDTFRRIDETLRRRDVDDDRAWLWRRPEGLNIRTRVDMRRFERVLQHVRPDLVCLGPAYKLFNTGKGEDHETVAADVLSRLDGLRTRYRFALAMEQHAPHGEARHRDLRPFGSSAWLRWPELGLALDPWYGIDNGWKPGHLLQVKRWRGDRVTCTWPNWLHRDTNLLWNGHYDAKAPLPSPEHAMPAAADA